MATNFSRSLTQDSDEVKEMYCEDCERHGDGYATAVAFCVDCVDYLCVTCQRYHKIQFKTHKLQDSNSMPQDFYFEKCSTHPGQLIKLYCSECNKEACQECKDNEHFNCSDVNHLPTLASDIQKSDELINLRKTMEQVSMNIKDTEKLLDAKREVIMKQEENATETCKEQSNKLIATYKQHHQELIDDFDKKMEETVARLKKERSELIQKISEKEKKFEEKVTKAEKDMKKEVVNTNINFKELQLEYLNLVGNLKALNGDLEQAQKVGQNCKLLIKLKLAKQMCNQIQATTYQIQHSYIQRYNLIKSDIQQTIQSVEDQTTLNSLDDQTWFFSFDEVHVSAVKIKLAFNFDINHKFKKITSLLSEHVLLALDYDRCSLIIMTLGKSNADYIKEIKLNSKPWGVTKVSDYKIAVTFPNEGKIRQITFSDDMEVLHTTDIPGNGRCFDIAYSNNHFVVSYFNGFTGCIKILSISGIKVKLFALDDNGWDLFIKPYYC